MDDFEYIKANAWSFPPGETRGKLIYVEETKYGNFMYYYDETDGTYWYESEVTARFHREMMQREKERKKCSRRLKNGTGEKMKQEIA